MAHPLETFRQPVKLGNPLADKIPGTFVLTLEPDAETDDFGRYAERRVLASSVWTTASRSG